MSDLEVNIKHGGGSNAGAVLVVGGTIVAFAAVTAAMEALAAIPVYVAVGVPAALIAGITAGAVVLWRWSRRNGERLAATLADRREKREAVEAAEKRELRDHRLAVAAASAPQIHTSVHIDRGVLEAILHGHTEPQPTTVHAEAINR